MWNELGVGVGRVCSGVTEIIFVLQLLDSGDSGEVVTCMKFLFDGMWEDYSDLDLEID